MWVEVATRQELERAKRMLVVVDDEPVALFWHDDQPYAFANTCIHKQRELVKGVILHGRVVCPGHQWAYELGTGYCRERDRFQPIYPVRIEGDAVLVSTQPIEAGEAIEAGEDGRVAPAGTSAETSQGQWS